MTRDERQARFDRRLGSAAALVLAVVGAFALGGLAAYGGWHLFT